MSYYDEFVCIFNDNVHCDIENCLGNECIFYPNSNDVHSNGHLKNKQITIEEILNEKEK